MRMVRNRRQVGSIFLFSLIILLVMSLACITLINNALMQQKISAGDHREITSFEATESVIQASINRVFLSPSMRSILTAGNTLKTCLAQHGLVESTCVGMGFPISVDSKTPSKRLLAEAETTYLGSVPVLGFAQDSAHYERFSTVGRSYFSDVHTKNLEETHEQVWQFLVTGSANFRE